MKTDDRTRRWLAGAVLAAVAVAATPPNAGLGAEAKPAAPENSPAALTAADILRAVRDGQATRHDQLDGQLRDDTVGVAFPFRLVADGAQVRYEFRGPPPTSVQVHYSEDHSDLVESGPDGSGKLTPANFDKRILGSDLTYEDLALRFVYWSRAVIEGEDRIRLQAAWRLRLTPPNHNTEYSSVVLWVDRDNGALLQAEGYDWSGKLTKRFEVISGQQLAPGKWYLKQMRIESLDPATGHIRSRSYLEIKGLAR